MSDNAPKAGRRLERKLSAKIITGQDKPGAHFGRKEETDLFSVIGVATETFSGESNFGAYHGLIGEFETTCLVGPNAGEVKQGNKLYLNEPAYSAVAGTLRPGERVGFAFVIGAEPSDNQFGYIYFARSLAPPQEDELMAQLRNAAQAALQPPPEQGKIADKSGS
jgi:hypothetical protein